MKLIILFLKPVLCNYFANTSKNRNEIHPSVLRACYPESTWNRKLRKIVINALDNKLSKYMKILKRFHNLILNALLLALGSFSLYKLHIVLNPNIGRSTYFTVKLFFSDNYYNKNIADELKFAFTIREINLKLTKL